jgi:hypothetical protein
MNARNHMSGTTNQDIQTSFAPIYKKLLQLRVLGFGLLTKFHENKDLWPEGLWGTRRLPICTNDLGARL